MYLIVAPVSRGPFPGPAPPAPGARAGPGALRERQPGGRVPRTSVHRGRTDAHFGVPSPRPHFIPCTESTFHETTPRTLPGFIVHGVHAGAGNPRPGGRPAPAEPRRVADPHRVRLRRRPVGGHEGGRHRGAVVVPG